MAKKPRPPGKKYNFMDTYGDMMTLLMCFFVLLFAMSSIEEEKYAAFVAAMTDQFGTSQVEAAPPEQEPDTAMGEDDPAGDAEPVDETLPADLAQLEQALQEYVAENGMEGEVVIERGESGATFIRLSDNLLFDGNSSELRPEILGFLDFLSQGLNAVEGQVLQVKFNGHTASIPGSNVDDWLLAAERAGKVASYVSNEGEFSRFKIMPVFYGRNFPIADNSIDDGRAKNRRVDIIVLGNDANNLEAALLDARRVYFPGDDTQFFEGDPQDIPGNDLPPDAGIDDALDVLSEEELNQILDDMSENNANEAQGDSD